MGITRQLWIRALSPTGRVVGVASYDIGLSAHKHKRPALNLVYAGREVEPRFPVSGFYQTGVNLSTLSIFHTSYDAVGRLISVSDSVSGAIQYTYTNNGCGTCGGTPDKVIQETTPLGTINYTYDVLGRRASMTVAGQQDVVYTYDDVSRLTQITQGTQIVSFVSDNAGRRTSMTLPNGIEAAYTYDNANRLTNITYTANSQILKSLNYTYDPNNNRTSFNGHNRLLPDSLAASHDEANEMITLNAESLVYDANGNLIQKGDAIYTWDARNRLVAINSPTMNASFKYDSLGRRIEKTINGQTTKYLYDGWDIMQEIESDTVTTNYLRSLNIDETLGIYRQGNSYYYLHDAIGSTIALTDNLKNIATEYYYDPFGKTQTTNPSIYNPFQYTGRENDGDNHYHYRLRYKVGERFISEDPIRLLGGINFYSYVHNRPTMLVDPLGLDSLRYHVNTLFPYIEWLNDNGFPVESYPAYSGMPSGRYKPLPYGPYTGKNLRRRTKPGMRCGNEGWSLDLEPSNFSTNRTLLRIHPDEPPFGTKGCIGVDCNYAAGALYNRLLNYFNSGYSEITVEVTY